MTVGEASAPLVARCVARLVRALGAGMALFWLGAIVLVRTAPGVPDWWLPLAMALGGCLRPPRLPAPVAERPSALWRHTLLTVLAVATAAVAYGALATPSRHWDGVVVFDAKAHWLTASPTLVQPYFADPAVFHHSPDYPLLLPLLLAATERLLGGGLGRIWLLLVYVLLLATVATTAWRAAWSPRLASLLVVAVGLTPVLLGPGGGTIDSGYADPLLLLATTTIAAGLLLASPIELAIGVLLAIACKPEGLVYCAVAAGAAFAAGNRRTFLTVVAAACAGYVAWSPAQQQLLYGPATNWRWIGAATLVGAAIALLGTALLALAARTRRPAGWRWGAVLGGAAALLAALPLLASVVPPDSAMGVYLHRGDPWQRGGENVAAWAAAMLHQALLRRQFGTTILVALLLALWRRRGTGVEETAGGLGALLGAGILATALPFVLTHEADVHFHLRASLPRLLLHWLGVAWLYIGCRIDALLTRGPTGHEPRQAAS